MDIRNFINKINLLKESTTQLKPKSSVKSVNKDKSEFNIMVERSKDFIN